jgi:Mn-dependent DtxR family transcriptional regulator
MSKNKKTFTDDKILSKMNREAQTPACIAHKLHCATVTVSRALPHLYENGLVEVVQIKSVNGKTINGWYTELNRKSRRKT